MWKADIAAAIVLCFAQIAYAANLRIVGEGVTWASSPELSCWVTLGIESTGTLDTSLSLWQLVFQVDPIDGAQGTVSITDFAMPDDNNNSGLDYVFSDGSMGITPLSDPTFGFVDMAVDDTGTTTSAAVPSSGKDLLKIELTLLDTVGQFRILIAPNDDMGGGSYWAALDMVPHSFDVATFSFQPEGGAASIEFIPEPSSGLVLVSGAVALMLLWFARRVQKRGQAPRRIAFFESLRTFGSEPIPVFEPCPYAQLYCPTYPIAIQMRQRTFPPSTSTDIFG